jgi:prepilin-type N-terminal cleavage/methylation domain-containing protein
MVKSGVPLAPTLMKTNVQRISSGFTLIELLVVVVIIATLASLTFLGFSRMRAAGDRAATVAIMRQLQVANMGYAIDNNGQYVPIAEKDKDGALSMEWYKNPKVRAYLTGDPNETEKSANELLVAPVSVLDPIVVRKKQRQWDRISASYGINSTGLTWPTNDQSPPMSYKISQVANPGRTAFIASATNYMISHGDRYLWKSGPVEGKTTTNKMAFRHENKAVVIYYDGSTGFITPGDLAEFDRKGGIANPFWKATP